MIKFEENLESYRCSVLNRFIRGISPVEVVDGVPLFLCANCKLCNPHISHCQLANACYVARIDLSAHGFYIVPEIDFDWTTGKGNPFRYYTYGAAFAEVEIDTLTGDFHTRVANIFLDLGYSLNPAIDVGQVLLSLISTFSTISSYI